MKRFNVPKGFFGAAGSPLVEGGRVIANIGGDKAGLVAFEAKTGKVLWTATDDDASYSSGVAATIGGRRSAIFLTRDNLIGLDPATGAMHFQRRWRARNASSVNAATPLVVGDSIFVSARVRSRRRRAARRGLEAGRRLGVGRGAVESLRDERLSRRLSLRLPRPAGIRPQPPRRRVQDRHGQVEPGSVPRRQRDAGRRQAAHHARERRDGAGAGVTAGVPPLARAQVLPGVVRPLPAIADGFVYVRNENTLVCLDLRR